MIEQLIKMPKVELHLHLDGAMSIELASKLSKLSIEETKNKMIAPEECENLSDYLTRFDFPISLMQTKENLTLVARDLVNRLASQNIIYAEIRFAPMFHTKEGLTYEEIIDAVLEGLKSNVNIKTNLILCMMRGFSKEDNLKTIDVAYNYLKKGVCALDLAGAEDKYPLEYYLELFEIAKQKGIPFTIHAGENGDSSEVAKAINIGAKRIGHGIHAIDNIEVLNLIKERNILLEICPTSNFQTDAVVSYETHPIELLYKLGVLVSINTDNSTVSNISLTEEYIKLSKYFNLTLDDYKNMNINAINSSFLESKEKEELLKYYN